MLYKVTHGIPVGVHTMYTNEWAVWCYCSTKPHKWYMLCIFIYSIG